MIHILSISDSVFVNYKSLLHNSVVQIITYNCVWFYSTARPRVNGDGDLEYLLDEQSNNDEVDSGKLKQVDDNEYRQPIVPLSF